DRVHQRITDRIQWRVGTYVDVEVGLDLAQWPADSIEASIQESIAASATPRISMKLLGGSK
ncbi:MAG: hypothetical protein JSU86_20180, partial [Phycisphaerales bacterium]